jgi:UrcA family protein
VAHIGAVDNSDRPADSNVTIKEIEMNKTTTAARAMTICFAAILGFNAVDASAAGSSNDPSATDGLLKYVVRFHELDLSKIEGVAALYARLHYAASVVCDPFASREMSAAEKQRACMDKAIADAVAIVNRPLLSQYHDLRTKGDKAGLVRLAKANVGE